MALLDRKNHMIHCKITYCGQTYAGKTRNLEFILGQIEPADRSELLSIATESIRLLFFTFTHPAFTHLGRYALRFHLYTAPGAVLYPSTHALSLKGADAMVFVADSRLPEFQRNVTAIKEAAAMIRAQGGRFPAFPVVLQYNKRDLPNIASVATLNKYLNPLAWPVVEAVALRGEGVMATLDASCRQVIAALTRRDAAPSAPIDDPKP